MVCQFMTCRMSCRAVGCTRRKRLSWGFLPRSARRVTRKGRGRQVELVREPRVLVRRPAKQHQGVRRVGDDRSDCRAVSLRRPCRRLDQRRRHRRRPGRHRRMAPSRARTPSPPTRQAACTTSTQSPARGRTTSSSPPASNAAKKHRFIVLEMASRKSWWRVWVDGKPVSPPINLPGSHGIWAATGNPSPTATSSTTPATKCHTNLTRATQLPGDKPRLAWSRRHHNRAARLRRSRDRQDEDSAPASLPDYGARLRAACARKRDRHAKRDPDPARDRR